MDRDDKEDKPGVIIFPPLIGLADLALGLLLDYLAPLGFVTGLPFSLRVVFGGSLLALGGAMAARARGTFVAAGTNVNPMQPALAMVTTGIFSQCGTRCIRAARSCLLALR